MLRGLVYAVAFYGLTAIMLVGGTPLLLGPRRLAVVALKLHARLAMLLLRVIAGIRLEVRGRERLPDGAVLVAAKHLSAWDTFGLMPLFDDPAIVMKAELMRIPFYGWFSAKFGMIPVRRERGPSALRAMVGEARERVRSGRQVLIFPEGTRRPPGAAPAYRSGVVMLYEGLGVACVPVALNSGLFWPRRTLARYPGTIVVEILEPIPHGLPRAAFRKRLSGDIETATRRLIREAAETPAPPPTVHAACRRLETMADEASR